MSAESNYEDTREEDYHRNNHTLREWEEEQDMIRELASDNNEEPAASGKSEYTVRRFATPSKRPLPSR